MQFLCQPTPQQLRRLTYMLVFLTLDLILFGAFTRLTDSGLGCPDWPGCYASATPLGAAHHIEAAQTLAPTGPVTHTKAWIEMTHRYFAGTLGLLILLRLLWSVRLKRPHTLPLITFLWVCVQGIFGALTVTMKLFPAIVTLHLAGGIVLLALLVIQAQQEAQAQAASAPPKSINNAPKKPAGTVTRQSLFIGLSAALLAVGLQVLLGGWVSSNYAVLACNEFPTCLNGAWWPTSLPAWQAGFEVWRDVGTVPLSALTAIHLTHRAFALVVLVLVGVVIYQLRRYSSPVAGTLQRGARWLMGLMTLQIATGISNVVFDWPLVAAVLHTGGAAALVAVLTYLLAIHSKTSDL